MEITGSMSSHTTGWQHLLLNAVAVTTFQKKGILDILKLLLQMDSVTAAGHRKPYYLYCTQKQSKSTL